MSKAAIVLQAVARLVWLCAVNDDSGRRSSAVVSRPWTGSEPFTVAPDAGIVPRQPAPGVGTVPS